MAAFLTAAELLRRYDVRLVGQYASDSGTPLDAAGVAASTAVSDILADAAEEIAAACRVAGRYTRAYLDGIAADSATTVGHLLKRLNADLAFGLLVARRGYGASEFAQLAPRYAPAQILLQQLRDGKRIFDSDSHAAAGLPDSVSAGDATAAGVTYLVTNASRYFGILPPGNPAGQ